MKSQDRYNKGEMPTAEDWNRAQQEMYRSGRVSGGDGLECFTSAGGLSFRYSGQDGFWAQIDQEMLGTPGGNTPQGVFGWQEFFPQPNGQFLLKPDGRFGTIQSTASLNAAYEINGAKGLTLPFYTFLRPGYRHDAQDFNNTGQEYLFSLGGSGLCPPSGTGSTLLDATGIACSSGVAFLTYTPMSAYVLICGKHYPVFFTGLPQLFIVNPNAGSALGSTAITLTGMGFYTPGVTTVTICGVACTSVTVVNFNTITCVTPPHAIGVCPVVVTNPDGSTASLFSGYSYT